jgi:hypothetical protein
MAKVKLDLPSAVSGRLDCVEFAMSGHGCIAKKRKPPRKFDSPAQIAAHADFLRVVHCWNTMAPEEVIAWDAWASTHPIKNRLGETRYLSGYNWFLRLHPIPCNHVVPIEITLPVEIGQIACFEDGPYNVPVDWPAEYPDDATISFWISECTYPQARSVPEPSTPAGTYAKLLCPTDYYALWTALGIRFRAYYTYVLGWRVEWPGKWKSFMTVRRFVVIPGSPQTIWLRMDDCAPSPLVVDSSYMNNQTFEGAHPNTNVHSVEGVHYRALHFDGVGDKIVLTEAAWKPYLTEYTDFTMCMWWKPDAPVAALAKDFLSNYDTVAPSIRFSMNNASSSIMFCFLYGGSNRYTSCTWVEDGSSIWQHWAVVRNGTNLRTFKNGVLLLDSTADWIQGRLWVAGKSLSIGCQRGVSRFANGAADDYHVYDRALTDAEVAALAVP